MTAPAPVVSGCTAWAGIEDLPSSVADLHDPQTWCGYLTMSTDILWSVTGRRWRGDPLTETAVLRAAPSRRGGGWAYDTSWGHCPCYGGITANGLPWWGGARRHVSPYNVRLPRTDVTAVTAVLIDGQPFTGYELDGSWLERSDDRPWQVCGDRTEVTYTYGRPPPEAGRTAVVELAVELGRGASDNPDQACQLPKRLQSVSRQGLTYSQLDNLEFLDQGLTGLTSVDLWIRSVSPSGRTQEATVWSPDLSVARRRRGSTF